MSARKTERFSFPALEKQLKNTRMMSISFAEEAIDDVRSTCDAEMFKDSCLEDASGYEVLDDPQQYAEWDLPIGKGMIFLKVTFNPKIISDHFHNHSESIMILDGNARFVIKGVNVSLGAGSKVEIPPRAFHECEFTRTTTAIVCLPELVFKHLSFPAS